MDALAVAPAQPRGSHVEIGNAWGRLWADAPRLAAHLQDKTGFSRVVLGLLRAVDLYREVYGSNPTIETWMRGQTITHRLTGDQATGGIVPHGEVGPEWMILRQTRLATVLQQPGVLDACSEIVRLLDKFVASNEIDPRRIDSADGYPKFIQGLTYVVHDIDVV